VPSETFGPYEILGELGRGGMGVVFRARDRRLGRDVALKTIQGVADASTAERFEREVRAAARLRHPGIVAIHDVLEHGGTWAVVMELVEGGTLAQRLAEGPMPPHEAARLVAELARAVQAAHELGVIHRDLKPANVLLERDGRPRLADFGLARDALAGTITTTGSIVGTPAYLSPEAANGDPPAASMDVYGLGAVLYETLTGRPPFEGQPMAILKKVFTVAPVAPSTHLVARGRRALDPYLEGICLRALAKKPEARQPTGAALANELDAWGRGEATGAAPRKRSGGLTVVAFLVVAVASSAATYVVAHEHATRAAAEGKRADLAELTSCLTRARRKTLVGDAAGAAPLIERALELGPAVPEVWSARSGLSFMRGDFDRAIVEATRAIELAPGDPEPWINRGISRCKVGRSKEGLADLDQAVRLAPDDALTLAQRATMRFVENDIDRARSDATRAIELDAACGRAWLTRGLVKARLGDLEGGVADLDEGLRFEFRDPNAWANRARLQQTLGRHERAIADATRALALAPKSPDPYLTRSACHGALGHYEEAIADADAYLALDPRRIDAWINRGSGHLALGDRAAARKDFERALELAKSEAERDLIRSNLKQCE
jgi:serine/threonine-protein kinase